MLIPIMNLTLSNPAIFLLSAKNSAGDSGKKHKQKHTTIESEKLKTKNPPLKLNKHIINTSTIEVKAYARTNFV